MIFGIMGDGAWRRMGDGNERVEMFWWRGKVKNEENEIV